MSAGAARGTIRAKAMVQLIDESGTRQLVYRHPADPASGPADFHRLLGGGIEFGELAEAAAIREIEEELGVRLPAVDFLGVGESVFVHEGELGHEIVFLFRATVAGDVVADDGAWFDDEGVPMYVLWRPLDDASGIPLYPEALEELTRQAPTLEG
ncbi:NUDIX domain-containing protein [Microbacterium sp. BWT-B31]|uniref:NUDIX hydrolase n=1 Tax=Microbacterium sp. BWT-B31 TaxID=3232072 RepID=UPI003529CD7A